MKFTFATEEDGFDSHIDRSIRGYQDLWQDVLKFSEYFVENNTTVVDIGCSTGRLLRAMKTQNDRFAPDCIYRGVEMEEAFFGDLEDQENLSFQKMDIRLFDWEKSASNCCLIISMFTLQFIPKRDRQQILDCIYRSLNKGGAFIFSEKVLSETAQIEEMMTFCYYDWKRKNFTSEQILEKEEELRHMMKPLRMEELIEMIRVSGFQNLQPFWQNFNFVGIMAVKD